MTLATDSLPNDLQSLKALVSAQRAEIERLKMMIAKLRRTQFGRSSDWVCRCCEHIAQVPAPSRPIARGLAGAGLLAHVLVSKFVDHLPLYRQSEIYAREGVDLERSTLADWVGQSSQLLRPLINALGTTS
jgi:transposase